MMSDADIASGNVVSEAELDKKGTNWCIENCLDCNGTKTAEFHFSILQ